MSRPVNSSSAARPWPMIRGRIAQAPMSAPRQADAGEQEGGLGARADAKRMSLAIAMIAPAPAHTPSTAAMIGCGQARIARTRSPVMRVKSSRPCSSILVSGPMISWTSPPEQKLPPAPVMTTTLTSGVVVELAEGVAQLVIAFEGQRVLALGPVERDRRDAILELPQEMRRREASRDRSSRAGASVDGDRRAVDVAAQRQAQSMAMTLPIACRDRPAARSHSCW